MDIYNLAFIKTIDTEALKNAIVLINRARRDTVQYKSIITTAPHQNWVGIITHSTVADHYLIRNISGRIHAKAFELHTNGFSVSYRVHQDGKTIAAYESHLALWITQQLRGLMGTGNVKQIDLAEPAGRLVLKRYLEYRRSWSWSSSKAKESITPDVAWYYGARAEDLKDFLSSQTDSNYVQDIIKPGISANDMFERLIEILELPYIKGDPLVIDEPTDTSAAATTTAPTTSKPASDENLPGQQVIRGLDILKPATWQAIETLPRGWNRITQEQWKPVAAKQL